MTSLAIKGDFDTAVQVLRAAAEINSDVEAYVEPDNPSVSGSQTATSLVPAGSSGRRSLTFAQWDVAADAVAALFVAQGVGRGDPICLLLTSCIDYAICYQAAMRLGAVTSGINLRLGPAEQASITARLRPVVSVVDADLVAELAVPPGAGVVVARSEVSSAIAAALADGRGPTVHLPKLAGDDPVAVVWTSGSTGIPKGALFDHRSLAAVAAGTDVLSMPGDRRLSPLPFAHVGYMTRSWDEISHAVTTVITPQPWSAASTARVMLDERITVAQGVPTQWALLLRQPLLNSAHMPHLRIAGTGGSRVPPELVHQIRTTLGCPVVVRYTSTEASLGTGTSPEDPDDVVAETVGRPVPGVQMELVDEGALRVGQGEVGRVRLRSAAVMRGYVGDLGLEVHRAATAEVLDIDGWLTTGDLGWVGEDGRLRLVGRATEMLIRGGYNVYPAEVEGALGDHPAVAQVAVVGAPDPVLGEVTVAFMVLVAGASEPTISELRAHCMDRLADYKAPDRLYVVSELPLTAMAKVDKRALAAQAVIADSARQGEDAR